MHGSSTRQFGLDGRVVSLLMGRRRLALLVSLALGHLLPTALAAPPKPWTQADYGPVVSCAMDVTTKKLKDTTKLSDTTNYVFRGRLVSLNTERDAHLCFDTEQMRVAGFWTGGFVKWDGAFKDMGPTVAGTLQFGTAPAPGCTPGADWKDPRNPPEGPLPSSWAKFKGHYQYGRKVVLAYTVGGREVFESPSATRTPSNTCLVREFTVLPTQRYQHGFSILLCDEPDATAVTLGPTQFAVDAPSGRIAAGLTNGTAPVPAGIRLSAEKGRLMLHIPPTNSAFVDVLTLHVVMGRWPSESKEKALPELNAALVRKVEDLRLFTKGSDEKLWNKTLETEVTLGSDDKPYTVDQIAAPNDNPWGAWMRFGGLDFTPQGEVLLTTWDGDVWKVTLPAATGPAKAAWRRIATGLQQPLGIKVIDGVIYTAARDQISRLHDLNGDGEIDFVENFNNDAGLTLQRHEFVLDLQTDANKNLYYCRSGHYVASRRGENCCIMRLPPDGSKLEVFARGFREANGMSIGPDGMMTVADNEGNGIPQTPLYVLKPGAHYGYTPGETEGKSTWKLTEPPLVWLPKELDRSAGGQEWVTSRHWGPLAGTLLHTSYGDCKLFAVLIDRATPVMQAATYPLPLTFTSGIMRARFHPLDGQLYVCGLNGWGSAAVADGQFCRVRYTGARAVLPTTFRVTPTGVELGFSEPLDPTSASDDQNWGGTASNIVVQKTKTPVPAPEIDIEETMLLPDKKTVALHFAKVTPVQNLTISYDIKSAAGARVQGKVWGTINSVPKK